MPVALTVDRPKRAAPLPEGEAVEVPGRMALRVSGGEPVAGREGEAVALPRVVAVEVPPRGGVRVVTPVGEPVVEGGGEGEGEA